MAWEPVNVELRSEGALADVRQDWLARYTEWMARGKYGQTALSERSITYTRNYTPGFFCFLAVITFPIGLLFLLIKRQAVVNVEFSSRDGGTLVNVTGMAQPDSAASIRRLQTDEIHGL